MNEESVSIDGWVMRFHLPGGPGPSPVLLMLHGWTGDENSMWVFMNRLPKNALLVAPRGLFTAEDGGYSWQVTQSGRWAEVRDFQPAVEKLLATINEQIFPEGDFSRLHIMGFSQGAAFAYTLALLYPERVTSLAGLSGFLPEGASTWISPRRLAGLPIFITHGSEDDRVPVEMARHSAEMLEKAGGNVTYCEDNVGHKLSVNCFQALEAFYRRIKI